MIPRLWQCGELTWWQSLLAAPLSGYGLVTLLVAVAIVRGWSLPGEVLLPRLLLHLMAVGLALFLLGALAGLVLWGAGFNPSWGYETFRLLWLFGAWPIVALSLWFVGRNRLPPRTHTRGGSDTVLLAALAGIAVGATLVVAALEGARAPFLSGVTATIRGLFDESTTWIQTDACLAEHRLQYLTHKKGPYDFESLPGYSAERALYKRSRHVNKRVYAEALRSYRFKVANRTLPEPETLQDAMCLTCPGLAAELNEWVKDERLSNETRRLAELVRTRMLYGEPSRPMRPTNDRRLRYPDRPDRRSDP